jgi:probable HAF family extracellular repeat protein
LFSGNMFTIIDDPLATGGTIARGINDAGQIVGVYMTSTGAHSFLLSNGTYTTIDDPVNGTNTFSFGINNHGHVSGFLHDSAGNHGFLSTPGPTAPPPPATTADMVLRHGADGFYEIYDIGNNSLLAAYELGQVGTDWRFVGLGDFFGSDTTDMLLRSASTGGFEVYDIANNNITNAAFLGTVGMDWQVMGFGNFSSRG